MVRFRPAGMERTLFARALAQAFAAGVALALWKPEMTSAEAYFDVLKVLALRYSSGHNPGPIRPLLYALSSLIDCSTT